MNIKVTSTVKVGNILDRRGLGPDNGLRRYLAARVRIRCDNYVPKAAGTLKNTAQVAPDGSAVTYVQPYAHYQYEGLAMAGRAPKHYTGKSLHHQEAPMRGPHWDQRMLADHRGDLEEDVAAYLRAAEGRD
jgi:hypothetical protein